MAADSSGSIPPAPPPPTLKQSAVMSQPVFFFSPLRFHLSGLFNGGDTSDGRAGQTRISAVKWTCHNAESSDGANGCQSECSPARFLHITHCVRSVSCTHCFFCFVRNTYLASIFFFFFLGCCGLRKENRKLSPPPPQYHIIYPF